MAELFCEAASLDCVPVLEGDVEVVELVDGAIELDVEELVSDEVELGFVLDDGEALSDPWSFVGEVLLVPIDDCDDVPFAPSELDVEPDRPSAVEVCASSEPDCVRLCCPWNWRSAFFVCGPMMPSTWMS